MREQLWRAALIGPLVTASLQIGAGVDPLAGTWRMPTAEAEAEVAAAAPVPAQATDLRRSVRARVSTEERSLRRRPARTAAAPAVPAPSEPEPKGSGLDLAASLLLAAGIASLTWCALVEAARVARLGRRSPLEDPALRAEFERLKDRAGIRRRVRLERTARGLSPYATGVLFPRVVVPDPVRAGLDPRARRAMLAHELGHVARFDAAWSAVARTLGALLFFQPLNQLVLARLDENAEFACDAFAVRLTGDEVGLANC
ncbi:MAG: M56 family metallopeptidase, partial [Planctomycetota bacterium]